MDATKLAVFLNGEQVRMLWTLQDFMLATGFSRSFLYAERARGKLVFRKAAGRTVILKEDADAYLKGLPVAE